MIKSGEIQSFKGKAGVRDTQIEKDYVISWVIFGISKNPYLRENLIFKGGTVLKKSISRITGFRKISILLLKRDCEVNVCK